MIGGADNRKVFDAVVQRVAVFMVDVCSWRRVCYHTVFVRPFVGLRDFYTYVHKPVASFVQAFGTNWQHRADFCKYGAFGFLYSVSQRFSCAIWASAGVAVRTAVRSLCTYDLSTTKRAQFEGKFFGHDVFYANKHRNANAF